MNVSWKFDSRANVIAVINEKKKMAELNDLRRRRLIKTHTFCLVSFNWLDEAKDVTNIPSFPSSSLFELG